MNIQSNLTYIASHAAAGAAAGTFVGPLGTAGGAAAGAISAVAGKAIGSIYTSYAPTATRENGLLHAGALVPLAATVCAGSAYAAGALINAPVTLLGAATHFAGMFAIDSMARNIL